MNESMCMVEAKQCVSCIKADVCKDVSSVMSTTVDLYCGNYKEEKIKTSDMNISLKGFKGLEADKISESGITARTMILGNTRITMRKEGISISVAN